MSLESKIEALTQAVMMLTSKLESATNLAASSPVSVAAPAPLVQPKEAVPVSVTPINPVPSQPAVVAMPKSPTFVAPDPVSTPVASGAPFTDGNGLINYVMGVYSALGPQKGSQIQNILVGLGYQNINDVKSEHYGALYAGIEALKTQS